ncbi:LysR family transcriptional regulator [Saccharospirillum salsuginis]|uniref:LysR family transcriptional regulator n=1 Tax=Saccharospirillum salsuginis TaxID=418750 RepID=A0A918K2N1_9GAMM|nr:LysR family transcriptional regulator [Saccharospirillum salsuginis]GGX45534.1 LysR family transcriptional regulator [Saccharospirillum salsuginis]
MELDGLSLFIDTVRAGSITGAAEHRGMPKSTLSRQLRQFEEKMGVRLLERSTRRLDLTEAGEALFNNAAPFLEELEDIQDSVRAYQRHPKGRLAIQMPQELFTTQMGELISEFLQRYPEISLCCTQYSGVLPAPSPEFDLQFVLHDSPLPASDWIARTLMSIPQGLFIASHCRERAPTQLSDLADCRCILQSGESMWSFRVGRHIETVPVNGRLVLNSPDMQLQAAIRGLGLARLARYQADPAVRRGALAEVELEGKPVAQQLTVLYRSRHLPLKTRLFLDHFQNHIGRLYSVL